MMNEIDEVIQRIETDPDWAKAPPPKEIEAVIAFYREQRALSEAGVKIKKPGAKSVSLDSVAKALNPYALPREEFKRRV
jgi:hypothetical protein